jgi:hypothetical protein
LLRRVVWQKITVVTEVLAAFNINDQGIPDDEGSKHL